MTRGARRARSALSVRTVSTDVLANHNGESGPLSAVHRTAVPRADHRRRDFFHRRELFARGGGLCVRIMYSSPG